MQVRLTFGPEDFTVTPLGNASAREFAALLPLDLTIEDFGGNEKIVRLPGKLQNLTRGPVPGSRQRQGRRLDGTGHRGTIRRLIGADEGTRHRHDPARDIHAFRWRHHPEAGPPSPPRISKRSRAPRRSRTTATPAIFLFSVASSRLTHASPRMFRAVGHLRLLVAGVRAAAAASAR